ncbi:acyl carrier protein [Paenibacillus sp. 4624]|uniref:Acyl carrier protein n=1 Tax=Paenibacillus amylolyticus TaxID=1451 RepID=A0A5M9WUE6_PAEAM|nr:phosphopantetheine-binding protein [Paenibacillus amylolyticus]KAA8785043.1 acyl carrier protein [Paenibacillus amylolyticus]
MNITTIVEDAIRKVLEVPENHPLNEGLLENGINSLRFIQLVIELELQLDIEFSDEYLSEDNLSTITIEEFSNYIINNFGISNQG